MIEPQNQLQSPSLDPIHSCLELLLCEQAKDWARHL